MRGTRICVELAAALDDWADVCRVAEDQRHNLKQQPGPNDLPAKAWKDLLALAREIDPDPFRTKLRIAVLSLEDHDATPLLKLASPAVAAQLEPATARFMGDLLARAARNTAAVNPSHAAAAREVSLRMLRAAHQAHPDDFWINHSLGMLLENWSPPRLDEAIGYYRAALAVRAQSGMAWANLGNALNRKGAADEAIGAWERARPLLPQEWRVHAGLGNALRAKKDYDGAIRAYRQAIALAPGEGVAHSGLGAALYDNRQLDEALEELNLAVKLSPRDPVAHHNRGVVLAARRDVEGAIAEQRKAVELDRNDASAWTDLGAALLRKRSFDEAVAAFEQARRVRPDWPAAYANMADALMRKGALAEARIVCRVAVLLNPKYANGYRILSSIAISGRDAGEAVAFAKKAVALEPKNHQNQGQLGSAFVSNRQVKEGITQLRLAKKMSPDDPEVDSNLGTALYLNGELREAVALLEGVVRRQPNEVAWFTLGQIYKGRGDYGRAIGALRQAAMLAPGRPEIRQWLAVTYYQVGTSHLTAGAWEDAAAALEEAIRWQPELAEAHCNLGQALLRRGDLDKAVEAFRRGHGLGSRRKDWPYPSAEWLRDCEKWLAAQQRLMPALAGKTQPRNAREQMELAWLYRRHKRALYGRATDLYSDAFAADPKLAGNLSTSEWYGAACAAALAGCGQGKDQPRPNEAQRRAWRKQALGWLRGGLALGAKALDGGVAEARVTVQQMLQHWQHNPDLAGVRGEAAIAKLPEAERDGWRMLWTDVDKLLAGARSPQKKEGKIEIQRPAPAGN
jgi:tetratricopeptide (TPR) repeat protein